MDTWLVYCEFYDYLTSSIIAVYSVNVILRFLETICLRDPFWKSLTESANSTILEFNSRRNMAVERKQHQLTARQIKNHDALLVITPNSHTADIFGLENIHYMLDNSYSLFCKNYPSLLQCITEQLFGFI